MNDLKAIQAISNKLMEIRDRVADEIQKAPNVTEQRILNGLIEAYHLGIEQIHAEAKKQIAEAQAML